MLKPLSAKRYYFDLVNGDTVASDEEGVELPDIQSVREEAAHALAALARSLPSEIDSRNVADSEPSLGSFDRMVNQEMSWRQVGDWTNCADLERDADREPSLAAPENHIVPSPLCLIPREFRSTSGNQNNWVRGNSDDREENAADDPELDEAEGGVGDQDGLYEQCSYKAFNSGDNS